MAIFPLLGKGFLHITLDSVEKNFFFIISYNVEFRCLCAAGCNIDVRNFDNIRADITALKYGHNDIADLLDRLRATGQRDTFARQLVPTSKPFLRLTLRVLGNCGVGKSSLIKSLSAGLFSSLFRRSSSLQSNKCMTQFLYHNFYEKTNHQFNFSSSIVSYQYPN